MCVWDIRGMNVYKWGRRKGKKWGEYGGRFCGVWGLGGRGGRDKDTDLEFEFYRFNIITIWTYSV